ncbi:MAG: DUF11 domain-containing protein, partial [Candidatus Omnitrophica bacterium]|nr:DUF11 domain-containing protein [Candidatus Omnitrophota bacterium]
MNYTGGSGDGYSSSLGATADVVTIASSTQTFSVDDSATAISTITISQEVGLAGSGINTTDDIRVTIPSALGMVWDTGDTTATIGGAASGKVSGTVTYEDAGKTLVVAVSADFVNGDSITISDLSFTTFTEVGSDNLDLEIDNAGTVAASDTGSKTINLPASPVTFTGGSGDGYSSAVFGGSNIYTWTGSSDASTWSDQGNWDIGDGSAGDDGYPDDAADKALINATAHSINTGGVLAVGELEISASFSGTVTLGGALTLDDSDVWDGDLRLSAGTLDTSGSNYQINIDGNWTKTGGTFTSQSGTVNFTKASGIQVLASGGTGAGDHFYHLTHSGAGTLLLSAAVVVNGNLTNSAGTLDVDSSGNYAITLGGNFANTATFSAQNGTVTLNGSGTSVISGSNTFYNLTSTTAAKNITFTAGTTQTINANLTLTGTGSNPVVLRSSVDTNKWNITFPNGAQSVTNVDVKDSDANTNTITCTGCVDSGNNNGNWNFVTGASITAPQDGKTVGITPTVIGTGLAGSTVNIKDKDGTTVATTTVDANGNFEVAVSTALAAGVNSLTPFVGASSGTTINLTIVSNPSSAQVPVVTSPESGSRVAGSKPTIVGQTQAGASVSIRAKDTAGNLLLQTVGSGTADGSGNYSITLTTALAAGTNTVVVVVDGVASDEYTLSLTDPFGVVFDSSTNELIEGATVTLYKTGGALAVPGVDIAATDENPQITGADGFYSFLTANNDYYFTIEALGYTYPSTAGSFPAGRTIVTGSKGETFTVAGVIIEMDHPMDSNGLQLLVEKDANKTDVTVGEVVTYTVTIENPSAVSAPNVFLEDRIPAGFKYIPGKAILDGVKISDPSGQRPVSFSVGTIGAGVTKTLKYQLVVGSGVVPGDYTNRAFARFSGGTVISNTANQTVKIVPDAVFDLGLAIGKVFWDRNEDGIQNNADERGLSFIKIVTEDGKVITTDKDGKFSIPAMKPGRHLLRLDERTLPEGSYLTTPKVVIIDVRPGLPLKANFGVNTNAKIIDESLSKVIMDVDRGRPVPRLSVTARCLKLTDQKQKENCPIEFNIHSNYSNFIEKWELEIIEKESGAVIKTFGGDVSTMDDPIYWEDYEKDKHYEHRLTVYGAKGRHDQTRAQKINFDIEDDDD